MQAVNAWVGGTSASGARVVARVNPGGALELSGTSGAYATTPHHTRLSVVGDLDMRADVTIADWQDAAPDGTRATFAAKWDSGQRSYWLGVENDGRLSLFWSTNGTNSNLRHSTVAVPVSSGRLAVRATLDADNGSGGHDVTFHTGPTINGPWAQLGAVVTNSGAVAINAGAAEGSIGAADGGAGRPMGGLIHRIQVRQGISGSRVADVDFGAAGFGVSSLLDTTGLVWTMQGSAEVTGTLMDVRLAVADNPAMTSPIFFGPATPDEWGTVRLEAIALSADTPYWWSVEVDSVLPETADGQFRTHPATGQPADFAFWAASCAGSNPEVPGSGDVLAAHRLSDHPVFEAIRNQSTLFGWHGGDFTYYDPGQNPGRGFIPDGVATLPVYVRMFDDLLAQQRQHSLYRNTPVYVSYDDHDAGTNNHDRTHPGVTNAQEAYRLKVPHPPLPDGDGLYYSWIVGRVLFMAADVRSFRDPNSSPQTASKTMLGSGQKSWMAQVLSDTPAEFLVWLMPSQWNRATVASGSGADTWGNFPHERDEIVTMLGNLGWLDRMILVQGDWHNMGLDSGANNEWGGFPVYQLAPLDSGPSAGVPDLWDSGHIGNARGLYGTIRLADTGDQITVTATGWQISTALFSHSFTVPIDAPPPPPPPPPAPEPVARAVIRTRVTWLGCDLVTGRIIAELPDIRGQVRRLIGVAESASLTVPIPMAGPGAVPLTTVLQATRPAETLIVAVVNDLPIWGGIPLDREGGTDAELRIGTVTPEGFLDRRYVGDHDLSEVDESAIVAALLSDAQVEGIGLLLDAPPTGRIRTRAYADQDDATVYQRLQELSQVVDGPEWTIDLDWTDTTMTAVAKIVRLRPRLGVAAEAPDAVFQSTASSVFDARGSSQARYVYKEDYTDGRYANHIVAIGSGEGEDRVQAPPARDEPALAAGAPRWERRFQPSTSITDVAVLVDHATADLGRRRHGAQTWGISARWDATPRYGVDWQLGDDVAWDLKGHRHPDGVRGQGRAIGFELDMQAGVLAPILLDPASDGGV